MSLVVTREAVLRALGVLEGWYAPLKADRRGALADGLFEENLTADEVAEMLRRCKREWRSKFFPTISALLDYARPPRTAGPDDAARSSYDPIAHLEKDISTQRAWAAFYDRKGDAFAVDRIRRDVARMEDDLNRRLEARGRKARYVAPGVEDFSTTMAHASDADEYRQGGFREWSSPEDE